MKNDLLSEMTEALARREANSFQVLKNHDSINGKCDMPRFESYTLPEYNDQFCKDFATLDEARESDPEYNFTHEEAQEWIEETEENIRLRDQEIKEDQIL